MGKIMRQVVEEFRRISGTHPLITKSEENDAVLGWRVGMERGVKVTLVATKMMNFLRRLNTIVLPRVRDFEGLYPNDFITDDEKAMPKFELVIETSSYRQPDALQMMKDFGFPFGDPRPPKVVIEEEEDYDPYAKFKKGKTMWCSS